MMSFAARLHDVQTLVERASEAGRDKKMPMEPKPRGRSDHRRGALWDRRGLSIRCRPSARARRTRFSKATGAPRRDVGFCSGYPGIRCSDSDMYTLGYSFRPWTHAKAIADGHSILAYLRETAEKYGIDRAIRYGHRVERIRWSSREARWSVDARDVATGRLILFTCSFLFSCTGYYDYEGGYEPKFPGAERFRGRIVHPQKWSSDVAYEGKRVVIIGSGATAVTLVPELAKRAAHVTMLQRSPTYIVSLPERDSIADWLRESTVERVGLRDYAMEERTAQHGVFRVLPALSGRGEKETDWLGPEAAAWEGRH